MVCIWRNNVVLAKLVNGAEGVVEEEEGVAMVVVGETEEEITMVQGQTETTMGETGLVHIERKRNQWISCYVF